MKFALSLALFFVASAAFAGLVEPQVNGVPTSDDPSISVTDLRPGTTLAVWTRDLAVGGTALGSVTHTLRIVSVVDGVAVLEIEHERRERRGDRWAVSAWSTFAGRIARGGSAKVSPDDASRPVSLRYPDLLEVRKSD